MVDKDSKFQRFGLVNGSASPEFTMAGASFGSLNYVIRFPKCPDLWWIGKHRATIGLHSA